VSWAESEREEIPVAIVENPTTAAGEDGAAIAELHEIVTRQRAAFLADPFPALEERQAHLGALAGMLISHRGQIEEANSAAAHGALASLPFGGVGYSGMGRHHGIEGFREFSNLRSVFVRGEGDLLEVFAPPYGPAAQAIVDAAFSGGD
jgi:hypothetical protein